MLIEQAAKSEQTYAGWLRDYGVHGRPLPVDFRALLPELGATERASHLLHPYPAKLLRHIPALLVGAPQLSDPGDLVLDPFCGSGTVLLESLIAHRNAVGCDANPLATLVARVKTTPLDANRASSSAPRLGAIGASDWEPPTRLRYWYSERLLGELLRLREAVERVEDGPFRDFYRVCFSSCARRLSLADPRVAVPVRLRAERYAEGHWLRAKAETRLKELEVVDVQSAFNDLVNQNARRIARFTRSVDPIYTSTVFDGDARLLDSGDNAASLASESVDLIVTSPPYLGAQKYIRATSLGLLWLGLQNAGDLRDLTSRSIGRDYFNTEAMTSAPPRHVEEASRIIDHVRDEYPMRAHIAAVYLDEMKSALASACRVLKPGGHLVLVVGGNTLCGHEFNTPSYLRALAEQESMQLQIELVDTIRSRGLMTRRNRAASPITQESVLIFEKDTP